MLSGGYFGLLGRSLGVLGGLRQFIEGPWRVLGDVLGDTWDAFSGFWACPGGSYGATAGLMKTLKNHMFLLCFEDLEVLERALGSLALGALGGPREVPENSLGILGGPWWVLVGSLGLPYAETLNRLLFLNMSKEAWGSLGPPWGILDEPWGIIVGPWRVPGEALGGPRGC